MCFEYTDFFLSIVKLTNPNDFNRLVNHSVWTKPFTILGKTLKYLCIYQQIVVCIGHMGIEYFTARRLRVKEPKVDSLTSYIAN
jgi:hypothetical protein